jgi:hypothetical protein
VRTGEFRHPDPQVLMFLTAAGVILGIFLLVVVVLEV